jgi:hypothetical protein
MNSIELILGRESTIPIKKPTKQGTSYFSYGRICFKPTAINLLGRIHIDKDNSFIYNDSGLHGLYEVARIRRMPLHTTARASIGKCLGSLQFYYATHLQIPDNFDVMAMIAIGRKGPKENLPPQLQEREQPNDRKPLTEIAMEGRFRK